MFFHTFLKTLSGALLLGITISGYAGTQTLIQKRALSDIEFIHNIFEVKYAPRVWKEDFADWDLDQAVQEAKNKLRSISNPTVKQCQIIERDLCNTAMDYHVGVRFYSTETASLPFLIKGAEGRYFVGYVDREQLTKSQFPFDEGDEIITFGSEPIDEVIADLRVREYGKNKLATDQAMAELTLTQRRGDQGHLVPSGYVEITGIKKGATKPTTVSLKWRYIPEKIADFSRLNAAAAIQTFNINNEPKNLTELIKNSGFFQKYMVAHCWDHSFVGSFTELNKHSIGARTGYLPALGKKIWKTPREAIFDAYIFENASGKKIGVIRLPHYVGDEEELSEFGIVMNYFQKKTDALVIDQLNNPGGSIFYLYALAATLTDEPLHTPKHHIALTQEEVYVAHTLLSYLELATDDETARIVLGDNAGGYPIDLQFVKLMKQFCHFLIKEWQAGKTYSDATFLYGVDQIQPHPHYRYSKPILLLVNSLDFSGGDFFPAILQDNKRATVMGSQTAGAGGYVLSVSYPNHSGIKNVALTGSLAERIDHNPIENLGVTPDIHCTLTATDLQENYKDFVSKILNAVDSIVAAH